MMTITRLVALPILSAGIIGAAALGMAGAANAATSTQPTGPGYSYAPPVKAKPAPSALPGSAGRHGDINYDVNQLPNQLGR